jgi:hypothetical protein
MVVEALRQGGYITGVDMDPFTVVTWRYTSRVPDAVEHSGSQAAAKARTTVKGRK